MGGHALPTARLLLTPLRVYAAASTYLPRTPTCAYAAHCLPCLPTFAAHCSGYRHRQSNIDVIDIE